MAPQKARLNELDYLKCVFIILMIIFHLVYIGDTYPAAKQFVYTFHMPGFLIISGYLLNRGKPVKAFAHAMLWILIPYLVMEAGYTYMASLLPIREHIDQLTGWILLDKLFVHPLGPYWYLHTLIICSIVTYVVCKVVYLHGLGQMIILALCLWGVSLLGLVSWVNAAYFWVGVVISKSGLNFLEVFRPTYLSLLFVIALALFVPGSMDRGTLGGAMIVYLMMSFLLWTYRYFPKRGLKTVHFIGRNTLILLLFSPIFTVLSKTFQSALLFEPTGMLFMVVALLFTLLGCFSIAYLSDRWHLSRYLFGKEKIIQ